MSDYFEFRGKSAQMSFALRRKSRFDSTQEVKYNLIFEDVDDLTALLSMDADEPVVFDDESMPYSQFKEKYLSNANRIYVSREVQFMDMVDSSNLPSILEKISKEPAKVR